MLQKTIYKYMTNMTNGLAALEVPTSFGKTYSIVHAICDYLKAWREQGNITEYAVTDGGGFRQIIFVTTLIKNLPSKELRNLLGNELFEEEVTELEANYKTLAKSLDVLKSVPSVFNSETLQNLIKYIEIFENNQITDSEFRKEIQEKIGSLDLSFRQEITSILKNDGKRTKASRLKAIKKEKKYSWIKNVYPSVLVDEKKVILMTIDKLMMGRQVIVENYPYLSPEFLHNKIVFIDEFDATKDYIIKDIIKPQLALRTDLLDLFLNIRDALVEKRFSNDLLQANKRLETKKLNLDVLTKRAIETYENYYLSYPYRTESTERTRTFIFNDGAVLTIAKKSNKDRLWGVLEKSKSRIAIKQGTGADYAKSYKEGNVKIDEMIRWITGFIKLFSKFLYEWATEYANLINEQKKDNHINGSEEEMMTFDDAVSTILKKITTDRKQGDILRKDLLALHYKEVKGLGEITDSYYKDGFLYYELSDDSRHNDDTIISMVNVSSTPESILLIMTENALVFAVSATATVPSVTGNYSLRFIKDNLGAKYVNIIDSENELKKFIHEELNKKYQPYQDKIKVNVQTILTGDSDIEGMLRIFESKSIAKQIINKVSVSVCETDQNINNDYYIERYCNIAKVMRDFAKHPELQSLLYLGMASAKDENGSTLRKDVLGYIVERVNKDANLQQNDAIDLFYLTSSTFDDDKAHMSELLKAGKKMFIISTYKTVGAGQNLQHPVCEKYRPFLIELPKKDGDTRDYSEKDIDSIYLGDITHLVANLQNRKEFDEETLLRHIIQAEELYENFEISSATKKKMVRAGFDSISKEEGTDMYNILSQCRSISLMRTRDVIQATGRMGRTNLRNQNIRIYVDERVLGGLDKLLLGDNILLSPEMKAISDKVGKYTSSYTEQKSQVVLEAIKRTEDGRRLISRILYNSEIRKCWYRDYIELWEHMRETVLKHPTANEQLYSSESLIHNLYISNGGGVLSYYHFAICNDNFHDVKIGFDGKEVLKRETHDDDSSSVIEVSHQAVRLDVILNYPGLKEYFVQQGYATEFTAEKYIMSPILYQNIYKGALGEVAGKYILEDLTGVRLKDICNSQDYLEEDARKYEKFDYQIEGRNGEYVDFKHWTVNTKYNQDEVFTKIRQKMEYVGAQRVYIINIVKPSSPYRIIKSEDGRIVTIPYLIDSEGHVDEEIKTKIMEEILC